MRANLDYRDKVYQSWIFGEWSDMIGYENRFFINSGFSYNHDFFGWRTSSMTEGGGGMTWLAT